MLQTNPETEKKDLLYSQAQHTKMRRLLTMIGGFSTRSGLGADEALVLFGLLFIAQADHLRYQSSIWESRASLGALSQLTSIPKETVRRKLKRMADRGLIEQKKDAIYSINTLNDCVADICAEFQRI